MTARMGLAIAGALLLAGCAQGPERVVEYLARYTHRVGISNGRLRSVTPDEVTFVARDRGKKQKKRLVKLTPQEFTRRFLLHVIPKGYRRIRYFGFLRNEKRKESVALIRNLLPESLPKPLSKDPPHPRTCPVCRSDTLVTLLVVRPHRAVLEPPAKRRPDPHDPPTPFALPLHERYHINRAA